MSTGHGTIEASPRRPRIVVVGPGERLDSIETLGGEFDVMHADSIEEGLDQLRSGKGDGILSVVDEEIPSPREILDAAQAGVAVVRPDFTIAWHNPALAAFAETTTCIGAPLYAAIGCEEIEGPDFCPVTDCFGGVARARARMRVRSGKHLELSAQGLETSGARKPRFVLCIVRDITFEVRDHQKLVSIHRAGLELSHLTQAELAQMSMAERIDLLKANILQYSQSILSFKNLEIRLLDPETNRLKILLSEGMTADANSRELTPALDGNGVTGFVAFTGSSYLCGDVLNDPHYLTGALDARSSLTVPIIYRERVIGTFNVESPQPHHFTESDREFLEIFAREIAVALHTLDLLQAEKQHGGSASVEEILTEVSLPVDEIVADTIRMFDFLHQPAENKEAAHEAIRRVLLNARAIKNSIQKVGRRFEPKTPPLMPAESSLLNGRKILLADADPSIRRAAHSMLGRVGCDVDTARDGQEALRLARTIRYDVIIGDIRLPDMNGYEFYSRMRGVSPQTPVVLMTGFGYDAAHSMVKARQEGLRVVLYKPFRLDRLCEAIVDALDPQVAQQQRIQGVRGPAKQTIL